MDAKVCSKLYWYLHKKGINISIFFAVFLFEKQMYPHVARKGGRQPPGQPHSWLHRHHSQLLTPRNFGHCPPQNVDSATMDSDSYMGGYSVLLIVNPLMEPSVSPSSTVQGDLL